ncbi:hypothetical protein [Methylobacterium sp. ID0610]|uniref:hypothetical protein n=1 Tax=Methylobacterium carpenticola TaxID=3344827 RepID=UPI003691B27B
MIKSSLQEFCNRMVAKGRVSHADVRELAREVLPDGFASREEADMLIGLDRAVPADPDFADYLIASVVDFAVWGERPTGRIDADIARWLVGSLSCGSGPTATGARIAVEVVREAQATDADLVAFALSINHLRAGVDEADFPVALAA